MRLAPLALAAFVLAVLAPASAADAQVQPKTFRGSRLVATEADGWCSEMRGAGGGGIGLEGDQLLLKASSNAARNEFTFRSGKDQEPLLVNPDPTGTFRLLVRGGAEAGDRSALVTLDPNRWKQLGKPAKPKGWKYTDKSGAQGGVRLVTIKNGQLKLKARGALWQFAPDGGADPVSVHLQIGNQWYCSSFGGTVQQNDTTRYKARDAAAPAACPMEMCGNGVQEVGEQCDDGNLTADDGCANECLYSACEGDAYASTFEAIQATVFDLYGCTSGLCHGQYDGLTGQPKEPTAHDSGLVLLPSSAANLPVGAPQGLEAVLAYNHQALLTLTPANNVLYEHFAVEGDSKTSLMYQALYKKTHCVGAANPPPACAELETTVEAMPDGVDTGIAPLELEAIDIWLRAGAPLEGVVAGTADKLSACLPPATPQKIDPPPAPGAGAGVQLISSAWPLPAQSENEICMPIYYDFTGTNLIPADQQIDCPTDPNGDPVFGPNNGPEQKCFRWHKQFLLQDPQSHHSIIHIYTGAADTSDPSWGEWRMKPNDAGDPQTGALCDPLDIDSTLGFKPDCSGNPERSAACLGYGPDDFGFGGIGGQGESPQFSGSQETHYEQELYDGVYSIMPMKGIVVFNSHAFNLTDTPTTMNQYLNLWLAGPTDQATQARQIFEAGEIFWTEDFFPPIPANFPTVPPFQTREFCRTYTVPEGGNLFWLSSHTHRHGVRWRTWGPPNTPCKTTDAACVPPQNADDRLMYYSTVYNDPIQLELDPPLVLSGSAEDRTFLFCALYDNGSTPGSPSVKRASLSPSPPVLPIGGPCPDAERACISPDPAKRGQLCSGEPDPDRFCDSSLGAFDGLCDACPLRGGFTTEDEMFILLGNFFVP